MTDIPINEAIAMFVAVLMALGLVSFLAYAKMAQAGLPPRRRQQTLGAVWLLVLGLIALLLALRVLSGGPVIGGSPTGGGVWLGLQPRQVIALLAAVALLIIGYMRLRVVLQPPADEAPFVGPPPADSSTPDEET